MNTIQSRRPSFTSALTGGIYIFIFLLFSISTGTILYAKSLLNFGLLNYVMLGDDNSETIEKILPEFYMAANINNLDERAWWHLGIMEASIGNIDEALFAWRQSPETGKLLLNKGLATSNYTEDWAQALYWFQLASQIEETNPEIQYWLGRSYFELDNPEKAKQALITAIELNPSFSSPYAFLGRIYLNEDDSSSAEYWLLAATDTSPLEYDVAMALGDFYSQQPDAQSAIFWYQQASRVSGTGVQPYLEIAGEYLRLGDASEALVYANTAVQMAGQSESAWYTLSLVQIKLEMYADAMESLQEAIAINPNNAQTNAVLGNVCFEMGNISEARIAYLRALELDPTNAQALAGIEKLP